jgi:hypothetical protein
MYLSRSAISVFHQLRSSLDYDYCCIYHRLVQRAPIAAQFVLEIPCASRRSIYRHNAQITVTRISDMEKVAISVAAWIAVFVSACCPKGNTVFYLHEKIAEAALVWPCCTDLIVQVAR